MTRSRLLMLASGTQSSGLGGAGSVVTVADHSTLVLGREGVAAGVSGLAAPVNYAIDARNLAIDATSVLVLNPGANLVINGTLAFAPGSALTFGGAGVSRLEYATLDPASADPNTLARASVPAGYSLDLTSVTGDGGRQHRHYRVINQGANPMHDIAMTLGAIDAIAGAAASRLNELFLVPVTAVGSDGRRQARKWANTAWARYIYSALDYETDNDFRPGHSGRLGGLVLGLDSAYRQRVNLGIYGCLAENSLDTSNATSLSSKQRYFGLSVTPRIKRFYLTADLLAGNADSEALRREANGSTIAHWKNTFVGGGLEAGVVLHPWKNGFLRPRAALRYTVIDVGGYSERAPVGASRMLVGDFTDSLAQATLAVEAARRLKLLGRDALAGVNLGCKHYMQEPRSSLDASFHGHAGDFPLTRGDYYEDAALLGASLGMVLSQRTRAGLSLEYERGPNHERLTAVATINCLW